MSVPLWIVFLQLCAIQSGANTPHSKGAATKRGVGVRQPWVETHGYLQLPLCGRNDRRREADLELFINR